MFDPSKPVQTRDGRPARILATDLKGPFPIAAIIDNHNGSREWAEQYTAEGRTHLGTAKSRSDLINGPAEAVETVAYVNLGDSYSSKRAATSRHSRQWPVVKLRLKVSHEKGLEETLEVLSSELVGD